MLDSTGEDVLELTSDRVEKIRKVISNWASEGLRTIAIAYKDIDEQINSDDDSKDHETELVLVAIVGIKDPIRREVPDAVLRCQKAGITIRMVTGDNILTACKIAREAGILTSDGISMEGVAFRKMTREEKLEAIPKLQVLARSSPSDKHTLVTMLQDMGEVVAVTGDGTNDAPGTSLIHSGF